MKFVCAKCSLEYDYSIPRWRCDCGGYLKLDHSPIFTKADIKSERLNLWRYDKAYPIPYEQASISFDEGLTPLVKVNFGGCSIRVKLDSLMPSGSFKDRGTIMAINYLKNQGVDYITEDSSGNAGASVAAYCALGGIKCSIYIPEGNSSGKITQVKAYGAQVHPTPGTRDEVAAAAQVHTQSYAGHNWHPMFAAGYKSVAYEIWEQHGFKAPDTIFTPCGGGGLTLGLFDGFCDLLRNGQIERLPKIYATQPENCNPIYRAFHRTGGEFTPTPTIAEGTSIGSPVKLDEIVRSVRESGGRMVSVTESEIRQVLPLVWAGGIYIEPTSSIAFAAFVQLHKAGELNPQEDIVIMASGNGLKATDTINKLL